MAFSPDGQRVATGSSDGGARLFDVGTGEEVFNLEHGGDVLTVAFDPDGRRIVTGSNDASARVFDVVSGAEECRLDHGGEVWAAIFSPDGTRVATGSLDARVRIWIVNHDELVKQAEGRLTNNLGYREWRRYFGDEPYRKTRSDLPTGA